ncbi:MAG: hypothetical protein AAB250_03205 [Bdellovibrionota bacterium]
MSSTHLDWNLGHQSLVRYATTELSGVTVIYSVATAEGISAGLAASTLWISLWGRIPEGREIAFVDAISELAHAAKKTRIVIGADEFHLTSGIPMSSPGGERLIQALNVAGFSGMEVADYVGDLSSGATAAYIEAARTTAETRGLRLVPVVSDTEFAVIEAFIDREFPGRWTRELRFWRQSDETARAIWMSLADESGVIGFARMAVRGRVRPFGQGWTPGALRLPLHVENPAFFDEHDSCLGPIGVAASERGKGTGKVLLGLVLETLLANDARRVCIDWTNAFKYYEPLEYSRVRQLWTAWKG